MKCLTLNGLLYASDLLVLHVIGLLLKFIILNISVSNIDINMTSNCDNVRFTNPSNCSPKVYYFS